MPTLPTPKSLSSASLDGDANQSQTDVWTKTGWPVAYVLQLFDAVFAWDYLPSCLLCRDVFLQDYHTRSNRYCSSALANALLALAARVMIEDGNKTVFLPQGWSSSNILSDEAEDLIRANESLDSLPDIQALGILSLYQFNCGNEAKAQELADSFLASATNICLQETLLATQGDSYPIVRAKTYCAAVSLVRIFRLATGDVFGPFVHTETDFVSLDRLPCNSGVDFVEHGKEYSVASPWVSDQVIPAKIFQLTEWVYKILDRAYIPGGEISWVEVVAVYTKCLDWYGSFFTLLAAEGNENPVVLLTHMYYQFCLLCLFRACAEHVPPGSDIQPHCSSDFGACLPSSHISFTHQPYGLSLLALMERLRTLSAMVLAEKAVLRR
ncbi:hypothetical protein HIM_10097 [Hirsutella minnesotensis 3608]|uniref:Xylanolytic transcriptional activator regulatory domain-containing protein n=1 Tax=Hirsutella minnesotensis 3608 TaxID=1043627 RepID=A0A0F7ZG97_9HYPO|nr:hypothetical protein HIM_10097 [Hirsutella minnesotensis 3608]